MTFKWPKSEGRLIDAVVVLGTKNSKTLGHFPEGAFKLHAKKKHILCAISNSGELMGYLLFGITQSKMRLRITHLCVAEQHRGKGVARGLLNELKKKYQLLLKGMSLSCRKDYVRASAFWTAYGFKPYDEVRSRSREENYLIKWWYDFGNHDLFSLPSSEVQKQQALLDANVIIKLREATEGEPTEESVLLADWLIDEVDYYYAPEFIAEIHRDNDADRVARTRVFQTNFKEAKLRPDDREVILAKLRSILKGNSKNDESDRVQLAECIASGIDYFITSDKKILAVEDQIFKDFSVQISSPSDFVLMVDEIQNRTNYQSSRLAGVDLEYRLLKQGEIEEVAIDFICNERHEKKHEFRGLLTTLALDRSNAVLKVLKNRDSEYLGIYGRRIENDVLIVTCIRTSKSKLSNVLFTQLVYDILNEARLNAIEKIEIHDKFISDEHSVILASYGFSQKAEVWIKISVYGVHCAEAILSSNGTIQSVFDTSEILKRLKTENSTDYAVQIERRLWPVKFSNLDIPVYIIPIRPYWAGELFDYLSSEGTLFGAKPQLSWNRENVYYRSVNPVSERSPGRILWYASSASGGKTKRTNSIVACSYIDDVVVDTAKSLFQAFKSYGIYEWKHVLEQAKEDPYGEIKAIKFSDTELFTSPIPFQQVNDVLESHGKARNTFASPLFVSNEIFIDLYQRGTIGQP